MKVKTYRAPTLKAALQEIKRELGPDAFILGQKEIKPSSILGLVQKKVVEVTAAVDHSSAPPAAPAPVLRPAFAVPTQKHAQPPTEQDENPVLLDEVRKLRALVQSITTDRPSKVVWLKSRRFPSRAGKEIFATLVAHGIDEALATSLTSEPEVSVESVTRALLERISIYPDFLKNPEKQTAEVLALVGPTGVGKTTTIAKIAALAAFQNNLKVGLVTMDTFRIAAIEQLKTYGEIMGIPVRAVETLKQLRSAIESFRDRDLVLVDTAGRNHREVNENWELAEFLSQSEEIRKALVVSATTKSSDLQDIVDSYGVFKPHCLVFTKLDETSTHGSIVSELVRSNLPLAYVTTGQTVPKDIFRPQARPLVELAVGQKRPKTWEHLAQTARTKQSSRSKETTHSSSRRLSTHA